MSLGLSPSGIVNVQINMSPLAAPERNFGGSLFIGSSDVIDINERIRLYETLESVADDFGTSAREYLAATAFFSQSPRPAQLYIGRFAQTATSAVLNGKILTTEEKDIANFTAVEDGGMKITIDGVLKTVSALDLSAVTTLNGAAAALQTAITGSTVTYDAVQGRFIVKSSTTGATSTITYATAPDSGTNIATIFGLMTGEASTPVNGIAAETAVECVTEMANISNEWYWCEIVSSGLTDDDILAVAAAIEGFSVSRVYGVTTQSTAVLDSTSTTDIGYKLEAANLSRTLYQYSSTSPYAISSLIGRAATVNFDGSNTTITLKFKQEPGITGENLTASQAAALKAKNGNVFVKYSNDTTIIQEGVMANGSFIDERHGLDWLQNSIETAVYNRLYTSTTKIPQTDAGVTQLITVIESSLAQGVANGLIAPGVWNADGFGELAFGDYLEKGYYVYAPSVNSQSQADREARICPPIQIAVKLAGAIHFVAITINVNR